MRLLHFGDGKLHSDSVALVEVYGDAIPRYGILSHTWGAGSEEVTFQDVIEGRGQHKVGYDKLRFCKEKASEELQYFWVDTCCIDKSNNVELQEAINSMYSWYQGAAVCYVYLADVSQQGPIFNDASWERSKWFTRGWTLQELLAPKRVVFYSKDGERLEDRQSQRARIYTATRIHGEALKGRAPSKFSVEERLSWAERRNITREEDLAYCLLGLLDVQMPIIYGEGRKQAFMRLQNILIDRKPQGHVRPVVRTITKMVRGDRTPGQSERKEVKFHKMEAFNKLLLPNMSPVLAPALERIIDLAREGASSHIEHRDHIRARESWTPILPQGHIGTRSPRYIGLPGISYIS